MNILVFKPNPRFLDYTLFTRRSRQPVVASRLANFRGRQDDPADFSAGLERINFICKETAGSTIDLITVRAVFGGTAFTKPTRVTPATLNKLKEIAPQAPLHIPLLMALLESCATAFPETPVVLVFETAFFAHLPAREHLYGIGRELTRTLKIRRYGFHGLFHEAACASIARRINLQANTAPRILSLCMEPHPEIAAVIGFRPVMTISGITPMEGLPGQTTCGEIDPGILLALSRHHQMGPEQINTLLTRQSGLAGLVGRSATFDDLFLSDAPDVQPARDMIMLKMLQFCGAGAAAMGGVDRIVFSGRYADTGQVIGPELSRQLTFEGPVNRAPAWSCFNVPLDRIMANQAASFALQESEKVPVDIR